MDCCVRQKWFLEGVHHMRGGRYDELLRKWLGAGWRLSDFHVASFEEFTADPPRAYAAMLNFLGLSDAPARNLTAAHHRLALPQQALLSATLQQVLQSKMWHY